MAPPDRSTPDSAQDSTQAEAATSTRFGLTSPAFGQGRPIPARHTCDGADLSPALTWGDAPPGTGSFALMLEDPDAPRGVFTHWLFYGLPADLRELREGVPKTGRPDVSGAQGANDFGKVGYNGPCPPAGSEHRYRFTLFALDEPVYLDAGASKKELLRTIDGHVLARAELTGSYRRAG